MLLCPKNTLLKNQENLLVLLSICYMVNNLYPFVFYKCFIYSLMW